MTFYLKEINSVNRNVVLKCFSEKEYLTCNSLEVYKSLDHEMLSKFLDDVVIIEGKRPIVVTKSKDGSFESRSYFPVHTYASDDEWEFLFNSRPSPCIIIDSELKLSKKTKEYIVYLECARIIGQKIGYFTEQNLREYSNFTLYAKDFSARKDMQEQFLVDELALALSFYQTNTEEKMKYLDAYSKIVLKRLKEYYTKIKRLDRKYHFMNDHDKRLYDQFYNMRKTNINLFNIGMVTSSPLCKKLTDYVYIRKCEKEDKMEGLKDIEVENSNNLE